MSVFFWGWFLPGTSLVTLCFCPDTTNAFYLCHVCKEKVSVCRITTHVTSTAHNSNYFVRARLRIVSARIYWLLFSFFLCFNLPVRVSKPDLLRPQCAALCVVPRDGLPRRFDGGFKKKVVVQKRFGETAGLFVAHVHVTLGYKNGMDTWITFFSVQVLDLPENLLNQTASSSYAEGIFSVFFFVSISHPWHLPAIHSCVYCICLVDPHSHAAAVRKWQTAQSFRRCGQHFYWVYFSKLWW